MDGGGLWALKMTWRDMELSTDGESYIGTPSEGSGVGEFSFAEWARIKELARTNVVEELYALAQRLIAPNVWDTRDEPDDAVASFVSAIREIGIEAAFEALVDEKERRAASSAA